MRFARVGALLVAAAVLVANCSGGGTSREAARSPRGASTNADATAAQKAVVALIDALAARRTADALAMRCRAVELSPGDRVRLARTLDAEVRGIGHVRRVETRVLASQGRAPADGPYARQIEVGYQVVTEAETRPELRAWEVFERGQWRWCGGGTGPSVTLCPAALSAVAPILATAIPPLPTDPGPHFGPERDAAVSAPRSSAGIVSGRARSWNRDGGGTVTVTEYVFDTPAQAVSAARARVEDVCSDASSGFSVAGRRDVAALQILENSWIGLQVPGEDPMADDVVFVVGRTEIELWAIPTSANSAHVTVSSLAQQVLSPGLAVA